MAATPVTVLNPKKKPADGPANAAPARASADPIIVQGISPVLAMALQHQQAHQSEFDAATLGKLRDTLLEAVNPFADDHGFSLEHMEVEANEGGAQVTLDLSLVDAMGMDRPARLLLERAEAAGMSAAMFGGKILTSPSGGREELVITGLLEWPRGYVVRLYNLTKNELCHAPAKLVAEIYRHQHA